MKTLFAALALSVAVAAPASAQELQQSKLLVNPSAMAQHNNAQMSRRPHAQNPLGVYSMDGQLLSLETDGRIRQSQYFDALSEGN